MAENWNQIFSRCASRAASDFGRAHEYTRLPHQEPSPDRHSVSLSVGLADYSRLQTSTKNEPQDHTRHTVQAGALVQPGSPPPESPVPLSGRIADQEVPLVLEQEEEEVLPENPMSCWRFVEKSWFQAISAVVIISNVFTTIMEMDKPDTKSLCFIPDQVMLGFYVVELCARANYFGHLFLFGPCRSVCWNVLDIIVVIAGVLDQWMMSFLPVGKHSGIISKVLQLLRLLRLLRVFKIVRVFLDIDLSWTEAPAFQSFIGLVILVNSLLMGIEIDVPWSGWFYFEQVLLCIYAFELSVRLKNFGMFFFSVENGDIIWNVLDFAIVSSSILDSWLTPLAGIIMKSLSGGQIETHKKQHGMSLGKVMMLMRMLRLMRILRLAKLVKSVRPLFILVTGIMAALQGVGWVLVLTIGTLYAMGILATSLIGKKMAFAPDAEISQEILVPFSSVPNSMFTLFRVMSGAASDSEQGAIDSLMQNCPSIKLGFVFFMITSSWTLLSILTAVVSDNMIITTGTMEQEDKLATAEEDRTEHVQRLREVFKDIDTRGDGSVEKGDIEEFLSNRENAVRTARRCRVPVRDVKEVLQTVAETCKGTKLSLAKFVDHLADVSHVVTEKSVMKLEARLTNLSRHQSEWFEKLENRFANEREKAHKVAAEKALQNKADALCKDRLKEVEKLMHALAERTDASLTEIQKKSQGHLESITEALQQVLSRFGVDKLSEMLDLQLRKMQHELLCGMKAREDDISKVRDSQRIAALAADGAAGPPQAIKREMGEQPFAVDVNPPTQVADIAMTSSAHMELPSTQMEARMLATEKYMDALEQKTEVMFRKHDGLLEKMNQAADQGLSALAVDKFSKTLEAELRAIRQELRCPERQSSDILQVRDAAEANQQRLPLVEAQADLASKAIASDVQVEDLAAQIDARLLASEASIRGLQTKTEAVLGKIETLLEKGMGEGLATLRVDKISETLERELRTIHQELLCSLGVQDGLEKGSRLAAIDAAPTGADQKSSTEIPVASEGSLRPSPRITEIV